MKENNLSLKITMESYNGFVISDKENYILLNKYLHLYFLIQYFTQFDKIQELKNR